MTQKLENIVRNTSTTAKAAGTLLPIFAKEDLSEHVDYIIKENPRIREKVEKNPFYRTLLEESVRDSYTKYGKYIRTAKVIDSWDRITSALSLISEMIPGAGQIASLAEEGIEAIPKLAYAAYYAHGTKDYAAIPYWAAREALSLIPVVGDALDMSNIYVERARKDFRKKSQGSFLGKTSTKQRKRKEIGLNIQTLIHLEDIRKPCLFVH